MKITAYTITHHTCPVELREKACFTHQQIGDMLDKFAAESHINEAVIIQTCNRLEFYICSAVNFDPEMFLSDMMGTFAGRDLWNKYIRKYEGIDAVRHLFELAAGLDSQMIGENQILSQIKNSYCQSNEHNMSRIIFHRLFHNAFKVGKNVRSDTDINCGAVSLGLASVQMAKSQMDISGSAAMVLGAGENARIVARYLAKSASSVIIANRDVEKAEQIAAGLKTGRAISLGDAPEAVNEVDLIIATTSSQTPVLRMDQLCGILSDRKRKLLIIDLAVPRDIDQAVETFDCVSLYNIDHINHCIDINRTKRQQQIPKALNIIDENVEQFGRWYGSLDIVPVITELKQKASRLADAEIKRYAGSFSSVDSEKLKLFAESLLSKVLHGPVSFLKQEGANEPSSQQVAALDMIRKMFLSDESKSR